MFRKIRLLILEGLDEGPTFCIVRGACSRGADVCASFNVYVRHGSSSHGNRDVVKRFEWTNPHAFVFLEVKDEKGNVVEWEVEMMSLNHLRGYGWTRNTVKPAT